MFKVELLERRGQQIIALCTVLLTCFILYKDCLNWWENVPKTSWGQFQLNQLLKIRMHKASSLHPNDTQVSCILMPRQNPDERHQGGCRYKNLEKLRFLYLSQPLRHKPHLCFHLREQLPHPKKTEDDLAESLELI